MHYLRTYLQSSLRTDFLNYKFKYEISDLLLPLERLVFLVTRMGSVLVFFRNQINLTSKKGVCMGV